MPVLDYVCAMPVLDYVCAMTVFGNAMLITDTRASTITTRSSQVKK